MVLSNKNCAVQCATLQAILFSRFSGSFESVPPAGLCALMLSHFLYTHFRKASNPCGIFTVIGFKRELQIPARLRFNSQTN